MRVIIEMSPEESVTLDRRRGRVWEVWTLGPYGRWSSQNAGARGAGEVDLDFLLHELRSSIRSLAAHEGCEVYVVPRGPSNGRRR